MQELPAQERRKVVATGEVGGQREGATSDRPELAHVGAPTSDRREGATWRAHEHASEVRRNFDARDAQGGTTGGVRHHGTREGSEVEQVVQVKGPTSVGPFSFGHVHK